MCFFLFLILIVMEYCKHLSDIRFGFDASDYYLFYILKIIILDYFNLLNYNLYLYEKYSYLNNRKLKNYIYLV